MFNIKIYLQYSSVIDVVASEWTVTYGQPASVCALEGSSVNMSCTYTCPQDLTVKKAFWIIEDHTNASDISEDPSYSKRIKADCGNKSKGNCTLHIERLTKGDAKTYYCRITTNKNEQRWIGKPGLNLSVTGSNGISSACQG